jgi:hypothetical protein
MLNARHIKRKATTSGIGAKIERDNAPAEGGTK